MLKFNIWDFRQKILNHSENWQDLSCIINLSNLIRNKLFIYNRTNLWMQKNTYKIGTRTKAPWSKLHWTTPPPPPHRTKSRFTGQKLYFQKLLNLIQTSLYDFYSKFPQRLLPAPLWKSEVMTYVKSIFYSLRSYDTGDFFKIWPPSPQVEGFWRSDKRKRHISKLITALDVKSWMVLRLRIYNYLKWVRALFSEPESNDLKSEPEKLSVIRARANSESAQ